MKTVKREWKYLATTTKDSYVVSINLFATVLIPDVHSKNVETSSKSFSIFYLSRKGIVKTRQISL